VAGLSGQCVVCVSSYVAPPWLRVGGPRHAADHRTCPPSNPVRPQSSTVSRIVSLPPTHPGTMSVPGTAADVSTSYYDAISTVPGTGPRVRNALEDGTPAHRPLLSLGVGAHLMRAPPMRAPVMYQPCRKVRQSAGECARKTRAYTHRTRNRWVGNQHRWPATTTVTGSGGWGPCSFVPCSLLLAAYCLFNIDQPPSFHSL